MSNNSGQGGQETFGGLAKRWLKAQLSINGDPIKSNRANQESREIEYRTQEKAREEATAAAVGALIPPSWKRKMSEWEAQAEERKVQQAEQRRAEHEAMPRAMTSLTFTGDISGSFQQPIPTRVQVPEGDDTAMVVELMPLEPIQVGGGTFIGLQFAVPDYRGAGDYDLVALSAGDRWIEEWDPLWFQMWVDSDDESFFWSPDYGPATISISGDQQTIHLQMPMQDASSRAVVVDVRIDLPLVQ